jgi:hypothetical protein
MKNIFHLAPHERFNFGDIMYSVILKEVLKEKNIDYNFYYVGLTKADTSYCGGGEMITIDEMIEISKENNDNHLFIGGGDFIGVTYNALFRYISPEDKKTIGWKKFKNPFIVDDILKDLNIQTHYMSFGGDTNNKKIAKDLNRTNNTIYVRDLYTRENLLRLGMDESKSISLPDLVTLSSKYFKNLDNLELPFNDKDFIVFQIGKHKFSSMEMLKSQIDLLSEKENVIMIGFGNCVDHEDNIILEKLEKMVNKPNVKYIDAKNVYDILETVSKCKMTIGTSLHLMITAFSYGIPWITLNKNIRKIHKYQKSWYNDYYNTTHDGRIYEEYKNSISRDYSDLKEIYKNQEKLIIDKWIKKIKI